MTRALLTLAAAGWLLAGCGGDPASEAGATGRGGWSATDACQLLDKSMLARAIGSEVTKAELSGVTPGEGGRAAVSTCIYSLANGGSVGLLAREAPDADATPQAIEAARTGGGVMAPAEDVAGLGRAALWSAPMNSLQVFIDGRRYIAINLMNPPSGVEPKALASAIAKAVRQ